MTLGVKVIGDAVDGSGRVHYILAVFVIVVVAVEAFPALVGIGNGCQLEPAVPVVVAVLADLLVANAVVTAACVNLHTVLDIDADVVGS